MYKICFCPPPLLYKTILLYIYPPPTIFFYNFFSIYIHSTPPLKTTQIPSPFFTHWETFFSFFFFSLFARLSLSLQIFLSFFPFFFLNRPQYKYINFIRTSGKWAIFFWFCFGELRGRRAEFRRGIERRNGSCLFFFFFFGTMIRLSSLALFSIKSVFCFGLEKGEDFASKSISICRIQM